MQGFSYRNILDLLRASEMGKDGHLTGGYDERDVHNDISEAMKELEENTIEDARIVRRMELDRLDELYKVANTMALGGSMRAIGMCLKIMERRAHLMGLDHPSRIDIHSWQNEVLQLLKEGKVTIEDVRKELGPDAVAGLLKSGGADFVEGAIASLERVEQDEGDDDREDQSKVARAELALGIESTDTIPLSAELGVGQHVSNDGDAGGSAGGQD